ncbi:hypothetical protein DAI22_06g270600 [Oryza sativa Japonica Group]|nr:hypothetical protein DAI22_06g270600 [Oryza sativa Japonica Group]
MGDAPVHSTCSILLQVELISTVYLKGQAPQAIAAAWCRRLSPTRATARCTPLTGHGSRVPLVYLRTVVFGELLAMSQEEFGFAGDDGRITLMCDASVMEYVMCLISRDASEEVERVFLSSMASSCHSVGGISH